MTHESVVEQPMKSASNFPFEVIAVPQYDDSQLVNSTNYNFTDPINIKIRIRNKEETYEKYGIVAAPKLVSANSGKKVRLVSSDQTIMSFDLFVEPDTSKKYQKKSHKNFFHFFKPGGCLRIQNDDDKSSYLPRAINAVGSTVESNIISEKIVLKKNFPVITSTERTEKQSKAFMGKCKPGGCLDPPFNEDKYSYEPALKLSTINLNDIDDGKKSLSPETKSLNTDSDVKILLKEKNIGQQQLEDNFNEEDYSHSLITYPTSSSSDDFRMNKESHDMKLKSRLSSENKARISKNEFSEIFFMPPKKEKTKRIEENFNEKASPIEDTNIDIKKSNYSLLKQEPLELPAITIESKSLNNNNVGESKLFIGNSYLISEINSLDNVSQSIQENAKCVESINNSKPNLYNMHTNENTLLSAHSQDLYNINKVTVHPLEYKVSNSENDALCNKSPTNTEIQVKETKELDNSSDKYKETSRNESGVTDDFDEIRSSLRNIIHKTTSNTAAIPANKTNEHSHSFSKSIETHVKEQRDSVKEFQESFEKKLEDITHAAEIKAALIKSKDEANLYMNNIINNDVLHAKESQYSQKNQESWLTSPLDVPSVNEIKNTFDTNLSKDEVDGDNLMIDKNTLNTFVPAEESSLALTLNDQNKDFEIYQNIKNIFPDDQIAHSSDKTSDIFTGDKLNLMDTSNQENDYYTKQHFDTNMTDTHSISNNKIIRKRNEPVEISATELQRQASEVNSIRKQMSSVFSTPDKTGEKHLSFIHEERKDSTLEKFKHLPSSESVSKALDSNRSCNDRSENFHSSNERENSAIHDKLRPLEDLIKVKSSSKKSNEYIKNGHEPESNVTYSDNEDYAKIIDLTDMEQSKKNSLKLNQPDVRKQEEAITDTIIKPCQEDFLTSPYSSIAIDFSFRYTVDNDNKLTIHTIDTSTSLNKGIGDNICVIKSMIRANGDEIRIPINVNTDLTLKIKNARTMSEGTTSQMQDTYEKQITERPSEKKIENDGLLQETLNSVYKNLIPLNMIIQNLKEETSTLSRQQTSMKEILENVEKKPMRLIHTNAFCGCRKN